MMSLRRRRWAGRWMLLPLLVAAAGCAYFNTFYLARKSFNLAENSVAKSTGDKIPADATRGYEVAIAQSRKVLLNHSNSRWADDAVYVMSASYYGKGEYDSAMIHVGDIERLYPKSELVPDGIHLSGLIEWKRRNYDEATGHLRRVLTEFPKYKRRDEVLFAMAGVAADQHDRSRAVDEYLRLVNDFPKSKRVQDALRLSGEIYLDEGKFDSAAVAFGRLLPMIRDDRKKVDVAVLQAQALTRLGRGDEALELVRDLIPKEAAVPLTPVTPQQTTTNVAGTAGTTDPNTNTNILDTAQDRQNVNEMDRTGTNPAGSARTRQAQAPTTSANADDIARLRLQEAAALNQLGRMSEAIAVLDDVTARYPSSNYAIEAQFQIGYTYETLLDSLEIARTSYEKVGSLPGRSVFKEQALQRADALKSQIQLEKQAQAADAATEARAAAALRVAEILLLDRDRVDEAVAQYKKVEEDFPDSRVAARACYARAYIRWKEQADSLGAQRDFYDLVARYPATSAARSAIRLLVAQGADTSGLHALLRAVEPDTIAVPVDSLGAGSDSLAALADTLGARPDSLAAARAASADSAAAFADTAGAPADSVPESLRETPRRGSAPPRPRDEVGPGRPGLEGPGGPEGVPAPADPARPDGGSPPGPEEPPPGPEGASDGDSIPGPGPAPESDPAEPGTSP